MDDKDIEKAFDEAFELKETKKKFDLDEDISEALDIEEESEQDLDE